MVPPFRDSAGSLAGQKSAAGDKTWLGYLWRWTYDPTKLWKRVRNTIDLAMALAIIGLIFNVVQYAQSEFGNKQIIDALHRIVEDQRKVLEHLRVEGKLPPDLVPSSVPRSNGPSMAKTTLGVTAVGTSPKQFLVTGSLNAIHAERRWWLGTQSGLQFWPQIELPAEIRVGESFQYRLTIPSNITSGSVALIEAGPQSHKQFIDHRVGQFSEVGFYLPHLTDTYVRASVDFP